VGNCGNGVCEAECEETCNNCPTDCDCPGDDECVDGCNTIAIFSYPYTEDWEDGLGDWVNVGGDDLDWTQRSGSTPSSSTGPSGDHTSGSGFYMYTESSSPNYPSKTALLEGPCFNLGGTSDAQLTFWYHMFGIAMGTLSVEVSEDCVSWTTVWSRSGAQGDLWLEANVDLSAYGGTTITIRFRGLTGDDYRSDMAIDDISVDLAAAGCLSDADCDDGDACTVDSCSGGVCSNNLIDCDDADACTVDSCIAGACFNDAISCDDGNACTDDMCFDGLCENTFPACGLEDGCCGPSCDGGNDPDCSSCSPGGSACTENSDCCSLKCRGRNGSKKCKGN